MGGRASRLYYGWWIAGALAITETISWGVLYYTFAVLLPAMEREQGWTRLEMTGAFSLALLVSGLAAPLAGRWLDHHGARLLMTAGSVAASLLVLAWSRVSDLRAFYVIWVGLGLCMAAVLYEPAFVVLTRWFSRYRARAFSLVTFTAGFASVIFIPLAGWLERAHGWRATLALLSLVLALGTVPLHAMTLRRRPADLGLAPDGEAIALSQTGPLRPAERSVSLSAAIRDRALWWTTAAFTLTMLGGVAITVHLIPFLLDRGYEGSFVAAAAGLVGAMKFPGRLLFAPLDSRLSRTAVTALLLGSQALALALLIVLPGKGGVLLFVALFGAANGATTLARPALLAERYGPSHYGRISSILALALAGASALAPVGTSALHAWAGGYEPVLWLLSALSLAAVGMIFLAGRGPAPVRMAGLADG